MKFGDIVRIKTLGEGWKHMSGAIGVYIKNGDLDQCVIQPINCSITIQLMPDEIEYLCHINELTDTMNKIRKSSP
jgi:hypothetical protein